MRTSKNVVFILDIVKKISKTFFTVNDEQGHGDNKVKEKSNFIMSLSHFSSILVYFCKKSAGVELRKRGALSVLFKSWDSLQMVPFWNRT